MNYLIPTTVFLLVVVLLTHNASSTTTMDLPAWTIMFIAHRGGIVPNSPENTLKAFRHAMSHYVQGVEIDLRGTKDGEIVIIHDETVNRTTNGSGKVSDKTLAELKSLDAGHGERIPTYEEVLQLVAGSGVILLLDIKQDQSLDKHQVVKLTKQYGAIPYVIFGVRNLEDLKTVKARDHDIRTLGFIKSTEEIEPFIKAGVDMIRLKYKWIRADPNLIKKVQSFGKPVWTTVGAAQGEIIEHLITDGVTGIISDLPALINSLQSDIR